MSYMLITPDESSKIKPKFESPNQIYLKNEGTYWILKFRPGEDEEKRDYLAYALGCNFANVAEVRLINNSDLDLIKSLVHLDDSPTAKNVYLVRVANTYEIRELPAKTLESAVATKLVYSTLIRRRDAHSDNREYAEGIPVFYDHHIAFLGGGEEKLADIQTFFREIGDHGRAGRWRVRALPDSLTFMTRGLANKNNFGGYHYVNDLSVFEQELDRASDDIESKLPKNWRELVRNVGFTEGESNKITKFLEENIKNLKRDLLVLKNVVLDPNP